MKAIKAFFSKVWAWVLAHKVIACIIAGVVVAGIVVAIVVPISVSNAKKNQQPTTSGPTTSGPTTSQPPVEEKFTVTWKDYAGNVLETDTNVVKGTVPTFDGTVPNKPSAYEDETYEAFKAWDKEVVAVTADTVYTATYEVRPYNGEFPKVNAGGTKIKYGIYPQHVVEPSNLEDELNDLNDGSPVLDTRYEYQGKYYVKTTVDTEYNVYTYVGTDIPVTDGDEMWFKYEPIEWNVLKNDNGRYHLFSNIGLEYKAYDGTSLSTCSNNYKESDIRSWLNGAFYQDAFKLNDSFIKVTNVDNSAASTTVEPNDHACENTQDKVFLLSALELSNTYEYSFTDASRKITVTDYCLAHGGYMNNNNTRVTGYWTRSPRENTGKSTDKNRVKSVLNTGSVTSGDIGFYKNSIAPSIQITLS